MNRESECKTVHVYPHFFSAPLLGNQSSSFKSSPSLLLSVMSCLSFSNERRQSNAIHWKETWIKTRRLRWFDERERERESRSLILVLDSSKDRIRQLFPFSFFLWSSFDSFLVPLKVFFYFVSCVCFCSSMIMMMSKWVCQTPVDSNVVWMSFSLFFALSFSLSRNRFVLILGVVSCVTLRVEKKQERRERLNVQSELSLNKKKKKTLTLDSMNITTRERERERTRRKRQSNAVPVILFNACACLVYTHSFSLIL